MKSFKRKIAVSAIAVAALAGAFSIGAYASTDIRLFINGKSIDTDLQIVDGSSYVPLRVVSESLGANVVWDGVNRTINITSKSSETPVTAADAKSYDVNVSVASGPMKMTISKVTLDPAFKRSEYSTPTAAIVMDVTVENTSTDNVNWFVEQGVLTTNTKEQIDSGLLNSDRVGGTFNGQVVKKGRLVYDVKNGLDGITSLSYTVHGPSDNDLNRLGADQTTTVILK